MALPHAAATPLVCARRARGIVPQRVASRARMAALVRSRQQEDNAQILLLRSAPHDDAKNLFLFVARFTRALAVRAGLVAKGGPSPAGGCGAGVQPGGYGANGIGSPTPSRCWKCSRKSHCSPILQHRPTAMPSARTIGRLPSSSSAACVWGMACGMWCLRAPKQPVKARDARRIALATASQRPLHLPCG